MWPVQTPTLLLCLTDEEQLFAQNAVRHQELPPVEVVLPAEEENKEEEPAVAFPEC